MSDYVQSRGPVLRVAVIGGGTAGLAAAVRLQERIPASSLELDIFEASPHLGGNNQSFEGVPLFFSCVRSSGAKVMREYMEKLGLQLTSCEFTSLSLKDKSGGSNSDMPLHVCTQDDSDNASEASSEASTAASIQPSKSSPAPPISEHSLTAVDKGVSDAFCMYQEHMSNSSFSVQPLSKCMESLLWSNIAADPKGYQMHRLAAGINYFYSSQDQGLSEKHVREYYRLNCGTYYWSIENGQNNLLIERMRDRLLGFPGKPTGNERQREYSCTALCPGSRNMSDVDAEEMNVEEIAMEDTSMGLCMLPIQAMDLEEMTLENMDMEPSSKTEANVGRKSRLQGRKSRLQGRKSRLPGCNSEGGNVVIHCGTQCTRVEPLPDGTVQVQYRPSSRTTGNAESDSQSSSEDRSSQETNTEDLTSSSEDRSSQETNTEDLTTAVYDHVLVCVHPHVAQKLVKNCAALQSLFDDCPFHPVYANAIVHTDQSVKCSSSPTALTYEIGEDGSWILHIDCEKYYGMEKGKGNNNIVSIFYAPDTCDSIDPRLIKGRFSATLSKSTAHDQGSERDVERALRGRLTKLHEEKESNVYLCGSYYCYEQWSQDAFAMAVEVADCVVEKFRQGRQLNVGSKGPQITSL